VKSDISSVEVYDNLVIASIQWMESAGSLWLAFRCSLQILWLISKVDFVHFVVIVVEMPMKVNI
jgi:hypothetical protein